MNTSNTLQVKVVGLVALLSAAALALAACGGSGGQATGQTTNSTTTGTGDTVSSQSIGGMNVLVDSSGSALYTPTQERSGKVMCTGSCVSIWKPLTASGKPSAPAGVGGTIGTLMRPDGTRQVTSDGQPLYTFTSEGPGQLTGNGVSDSFDGNSFTWHAVLTSGKPAAASSSATSAPSSTSNPSTVPGY
jgi:predicted lipoprotein with Yx(FWY)xxD motif